MNVAWGIIGWILLLCILMVIVLVTGTLLRPVIRQYMSDRKREKAHKGELDCEETREACTNLATYVTPQGYFCNDHVGQHEKKYTDVGSWSWRYRLNWTIDGHPSN